MAYHTTWSRIPAGRSPRRRARRSRGGRRRPRSCVCGSGPRRRLTSVAARAFARGGKKNGRPPVGMGGDTIASGHGGTSGVLAPPAASARLCRTRGGGLDQIATERSRRNVGHFRSETDGRGRGPAGADRRPIRAIRAAPRTPPTSSCGPTCRGRTGAAPLIGATGTGGGRGAGRLERALRALDRYDDPGRSRRGCTGSSRTRPRRRPAARRARFEFNETSMATATRTPSPTRPGSSSRLSGFPEDRRVVVVLRSGSATRRRGGRDPRRPRRDHLSTAASRGLDQPRDHLGQSPGGLDDDAARRIAERMDEIPVPDGLEDQSARPPARPSGPAARAPAPGAAGAGASRSRGGRGDRRGGRGSAAGYWLAATPGRRRQRDPRRPWARAAISESAILARPPWLSQRTAARRWPTRRSPRRWRSCRGPPTLPRSTACCGRWWSAASRPAAPLFGPPPGGRGPRLAPRPPPPRPARAVRLPARRRRGRAGVLFHLREGATRAEASAAADALARLRVNGGPLPASLRLDVPGLGPLPGPPARQRNARRVVATGDALGALEEPAAWRYRC